jgi:hypothetical protein
MELHHPDGTTSIKQVSSCKAGNQYERITLDLEDFLRLRAMSRDGLQDWVELWTLGFPPRKVDPIR